MQIVLHIGTDKTGSTSIQNAVFLNRQWLASRSIYVPSVGLGADNGHSRLLRNLDPQTLAKLIGELKTADEQGYTRALLSWEGMGSLRFGKAQIRQLVAALAPHSMLVLVYLREQAEIIQSGHLERVKQNRNGIAIKFIESPRTPVQKLKAMLILGNPNRNYYRLLRRWEQCIPGAAFAVRIYSRSQLQGGDVVTDFLAQLKLGKDADFVIPRENYNQSLDIEGALLLEHLQQISVYRGDMKTLIDVTQSVISSEGRSSRYFLSEQTVKAIRRRFMRSNIKLAVRYMGSDVSPFRAPANCWRVASLDVIEKRAMALAKKVEKVWRIPVLMAAASGFGIAAAVDLYQGWSGVRPWGVWSIGPESGIRFRVYRPWLVSEVSAIQILIAGHYYGNNVKTRVQINNLNFGEQSLGEGCCELVIPVEALLANEVVDIVLGHSAPVSPAAFEGKGDTRALAFGLEKIAYTYLKSRDR